MAWKLYEILKWRYNKSLTTNMASDFWSTSIWAKKHPFQTWPSQLCPFWVKVYNLVFWFKLGSDQKSDAISVIWDQRKTYINTMFDFPGQLHFVHFESKIWLFGPYLRSDLKSDTILIHNQRRRIPLTFILIWTFKKLVIWVDVP